MASKSNFNGIVGLTEEQYEQLKTNGSIELNGETINYDKAGTIYVTPKDNNGVIEQQLAEYAKKTDIPRPLWLADSITLTDAGIEADYTIPKINISPLVATGYTIMASDKIMFATEKATYLGVVKSVNSDNIVAMPKFDMARASQA